jgi:hypothetical protein
MERPSAKDQTSQQETNALLLRLSKLPQELSLSILMGLDSRQLLTICTMARRRSGNQKLKELGYYCDDPNFWRDYLFEQGYDLPESLPKLVRILRDLADRELTDADILTSIFFNRPRFRRTIKEPLINIVKEYYREGIEYKGLALTDLHQAVLDWDYLEQQIVNRKLKPVPKIWRITLYLPNNTPRVVDDFPNKLSMDQFIQLLVDRGFSGDTIKVETQNLNILRHLTNKSYTLIAEEFGPQIQQDFRTEINEQNLLLLPSFIREGDLISIDFRKYNNELFGELRVFYYVTKNEQLVKANRPRYDQFYFPEEAYDFLIKYGIDNYSSLEDFYPYLTSHDIIGYTEGQTMHQFSNRKKKASSQRRG